MRSLAGRNGIPMMLQSLKGVRQAGIVRVEREKQFTARQSDGLVVGDVLALIALFDIPDRKPRFLDPLLHNFGGVVGRTIIDNQPLEVTHGLLAQGVVHTMQGVRAVIGRGEHGEGELFFIIGLTCHRYALLK